MCFVCFLGQVFFFSLGECHASRRVRSENVVCQTVLNVFVTFFLRNFISHKQNSILVCYRRIQFQASSFVTSTSFIFTTFYFIIVAKVVSQGISKWCFACSSVFLLALISGIISDQFLLLNKSLIPSIVYCVCKENNCGTRDFQ